MSKVSISKFFTGPVTHIQEPTHTYSHTLFKQFLSEGQLTHSRAAARTHLRFRAQEAPAGGVSQAAAEGRYHGNRHLSRHMVGEASERTDVAPPTASWLVHVRPTEYK